MRNEEDGDSLLLSHPWLPWVNPAVIQGILKNSAENAGSEIRKQHITEVHKFSNTYRECSTNLTHCSIYRITILLQSPSHLWCHPAEGKLLDCLAPQSPCSGHCQIHSLPLSAQLGLRKDKMQHSAFKSCNHHMPRGTRCPRDFPTKSATICPCKEASI